MTTDCPGKKKSRSPFYILLSLLVSCSVFIYLFTRITIDEIISAIVQVPLNSIIMFVFFSLVMSTCRTWRYQLLLQSDSTDLRFLPLFLVTLVRNFFSDLLPARIGTLIYIYIVNKRLNVPLSLATSSFTLCFLFDIIAVSLLGVFVSLFYFSSSQMFLIVMGAALFILLCAFLVLSFLPWFLEQLGRLIGASRVVQRLHGGRLKVIIDDVGKEIRLTKEAGIYGRVFVLSLLVRFFKYVSLYILFIGLVIGLGENIKDFPLFKVVSGMIAAELSASLPVSGIAGFGAYEGTWALVFQLLGYSEKFAVVTSISHHLITQVYGYGLGALAMLVLLLPVMAPSERPSGMLIGKNKRFNFFWSKILLLIVIIAAVVIWLFPDIGLVRGKLPDGQQSSGNGNLAAFSDSLGSQLNLRGRIVFQRPDGIYVQSLGEMESRRIVEGGSYPRWSNDGQKIVFLKGDKVMIAGGDGKRVKRVAAAKKPRAVCFHPDGKRVLYIDGKAILIAGIHDSHVVKLLSGYNFRELDISDDGKKVAATVKRFNGYSVILFDLAGNKAETVTKGCSASLSPDGRMITANDSSHETLRIFDSGTLKLIDRVHAPPLDLFDNQKWSNDSDWLVSTSEKNGNNIFIHNISRDTAYQMTRSGDCDRGDLYIGR